MKRPQKGDRLRIRRESAADVFEEACYESRPNLAHAPRGVFIDIGSKRDYELHREYRITTDDGDEFSAVVVGISNSSNPDWKRVSFSALIE